MAIKSIIKNVYVNWRINFHLSYKQQRENKENLHASHVNKLIKIDRRKTNPYESKDLLCRNK